MTQENKRKGRGCLFYAVVVIGAVFAVLAAATYLGIRTARQMIDRYTDAAPLEMPEVKLSPAEFEDLQQRVKSFQQALKQERATNALVLSSEEVNALIATSPQMESFRGKFHIEFEGSTPKGQVSIPLEELGLPVFKGRYFNGAATFEIAFRDGKLRVSPTDLSVKGGTVPSVYLEKIRKQNLAERLNEDPRASPGLEKLKNVEVKDGRLIITPAAATPL